MFSCSECDYKAKRNDTLKSHILRIHSKDDVKKYKCEEKDCKSSFKTSGDLITHMRRVHLISNNIIKMYFCSKCDYKSNREYSLKIHRMRIHNVGEIKIYICIKFMT